MRREAVGGITQQHKEGDAMRYYFLGLGALAVVCMGCAGVDGQSVLKTDEYIAPPAAMMQHPGPMVDGPGPGVLGMLAQPGAGMMPAPANMSTQVMFLGPGGISVGWVNGGALMLDQVVMPGRADFPQSAVYQLVLSSIPGDGWQGEQLYPTLEVRSAHPNTLSYLAHNTVPVEITDEDLEHVRSHNMVTKVIYLPDPQFQARAIAGVDTITSTNLDPGIDPIHQAEKMGTIMAVLRVGNKRMLDQNQGTDVNGNVQPVNYTVLDGDAGQYAPPMPMAMIPSDVQGVPGAMIAAGGGMPGQPIMPVAGMGPTPAWGMPMTGTPIGLVGPPHLPLGGPAGLQSHTIRNLSDNRMPKPVDHMLIDVEHDPGYGIPEPVRHIQYKETHPVHGPGEVAHPQSSGPFMQGF
ncbi:MAG: hypothetical protein JNL58_01225 [Planctomyces sp.]|nr:hypothetical protein [Planctomyces sp.]